MAVRLPADLGEMQMLNNYRGTIAPKGWRVIGIAVLCGLAGGAGAQGKDAAFPPHRVVGNVYYVGSRELASYLIHTDKGEILINSGFADTVPLIRASVEKLGFKFSDIKILLNSHAHDDHVAGLAIIRRETGAKVMVMEGDDDVIRSGGKGDFEYTTRWEPCPVDRVLHDRDTVTLGGTTLTAVKTPGHTRGCTTWTWNAKDAGKTYRVVVIGSPNVNAGYRLVKNEKYSAIAEDFAATFRTLKSLPCDVFLGAHGNYYGMIDKHSRLGKGKNPFVDPDGYREYVAERERAFQQKLAQQQAAR
jgi:metallo-beta-lactamase class B